MKNIIFVTSCALAFGLIGASSTLGQTLLWNAGTSNWFTPANWSPPGPPTATDDAEIDNGGTAQVAAAGAVAHVLILGDDATESGTTNVSGAGTLMVGNGLYVGRFGTGTLNITGGGDVTSVISFIANSAGSSSAATVAGAGSTWGTGNLFVGGDGTGTLDITSAGAVSSGASTLGFSSGAVGTVNVNGSMWTNSGNLIVGNSGDGSLHITNSGAVSNVNADLGNNAGSSGTVTVDGAGSTWTITGFFDIGVDGTGIFSVTNGADVTTTKEAAIAEFGGTGDATVDGAGSTWTITDILDVGENGTATLMVSNGGAVSNTAAFVGSSGTGTATVTGMGSTWTNSSNLIVGEFGTGTLNIENGGAVAVNGAFLRIGEQDNSLGMVNVDGTGSTLTIASELDVARLGTGSLTITNGGAVSMTGAQRTSIGTAGDALGTLTVDGSGSTFTSNGGMFVGQQAAATGTLNVTAGGAVTNAFAQIGSEAGSTGMATVDGMGSTWTNNGTFIVGDAGMGGLAITNGGHVTSGISIIGGAPTGDGTVIVEDFGSIWDPSSLYVGGDPMGPQGTGLLRLQNNGRVDAPITVWSTGTLEYGQNSIINGTLTFDGGTLRAIADANFSSDVTLAAGGVIIDSNGFSGQLTGAFTGAGGITKINDGRVEFTNISNYAGNTVINGGEFIVISEITTPQTDVNAGGLLGGIGTLHSNVFNSGVVSPGFTDLGTFTIDGDYTQNSDGTLRIGVGGLGMNEHGLLLMPNGHTALLDGTLQVLRENNFVPHNGDSFTILLATGGVNGQFANVISNFQGVLQPEVVYNPTFVDLVFVLGSFVISDDLTPNQLAVAHQLNKVGNDPLAGDLIDFIGNVPLSELPHDYDLIAPDELASIYEISFSNNIVQNMNLQHRMDDIRAGSTGFCGTAWQPHEVGKDFSGGKGEMTPTGQVVQPANDPHWGVFAAGSGEFINVDGDFNAHGYDITTGSFIAGADYRIGNHFAIGIDGGYTGSSADLVDNGEVDMNGGRIGAYATIFGFNIWGSNIHVDGSVGGGWNNYDTHRTGLQNLAVNGSTEGSEVDAMISYGGDWHFGCLVVGTWSSIQYIDVDIDGFTESGSLAPLHIEGQDQDSFIGTTGVRVAYDWHCGNMIIRPEARAAWMHESNDRSYAIDSHFASGAGDTFTVHGPKIGRDAALIDAGVAIQWSRRVSSYVYYDGVLGRENYTNNSVSGGLRVSF